MWVGRARLPTPAAVLPFFTLNEYDRKERGEIYWTRTRPVIDKNEDWEDDQGETIPWNNLQRERCILPEQDSSHDRSYVEVSTVSVISSQEEATDEMTDLLELAAKNKCRA